MAQPATYDPILPAFLGALAAAGATAGGAAMAAVFNNIRDATRDILLGFGGGVMLAASCFSLILPALDAAGKAGLGGWSAGGLVGFAIIAGAALVMGLNAAVPHEHFIKGMEGRSPQQVKRAWLFVFAICLHNLPEGFAIGVGYAESLQRGHVLATGMSIQDVPEGLVVALSLMAAGYRRRHSVAAGVVSGLPEPIGALLGVALVSSVPFLLPAGLAFAAGAMLFVISHEIIPESHRSGHEQYATMGLIAGFVVMMLLDTALAA